MNKTITIFRQRFIVQDLLVLLFTFFLMEGIFSWIFLRNSIITEAYLKITSLLIYGFMLYKYYSLKQAEKIYLVVFTLLMLKLVLESLYKYDSLFKQLTMFTVLFPVVYVFFIKYLLRSLKMDLLGFMAKFYLVSYVAFMVLFGRGFSFSLEGVEMDDYGPFSGDSRIIHASHIFMLIIPFLWFLHRYVTSMKPKYLLVVFFCIGVIILHQHRSVWSSALVALFFYIVASIRNRQQQVGRYVSLFVQGFAILLLAYIFIASLFPGLTGFFADRFAEIFDPAKEGSTGNFRIEQREVYSKLFLQRPIFGWTFEGFEMPNPLVDWWPEKTGQHFHEGYMEMLFYHGIVGLILKYSFFVYLLVKIFSKKISSESIILTSFVLSGLIFSFNYVLPVVFWGHVGMCLYYLEKDGKKISTVLRRTPLLRIMPREVSTQHT